MAEEEGVIVADSTLLVVQIGMADAAGEDIDQCFTRSWIWHEDGLDAGWCVLFPDNYGLDFMSHFNTVLSVGYRAVSQA
ncbi:hypothetical protein GCM10009582_31050 [Arthrobacter flavus]